MNTKTQSGNSIPRKLFRAIKNPKKAFDYLWLKINKLDPTSVSDHEAKKFFDNAKAGNEKLFHHVAPRIKTAKTIFDVGANSGYFAKGVIDKGFSGRVCLFEPIPNLLSIAVRTLSGYKNDKIFVNSALGEKYETVNIFLPDDSNIGWITLVEQKATSTKSIPITVTPTFVYASLFLPEFVKIDVEGFELFILRPFLRLISPTYKPTFLVELGWGKTNPHWSEFLTVALELQKQGYKFINLSNGPRNMTFDDLASLNETIDVLIEAEIQNPKPTPPQP
jgi:FkbM family methyltransferase